MNKIIFAALMLFGLTVNAQTDVICWDRDCLKNGWTMTNSITNIKIDYQCYGDGCLSTGWIVGEASKSYTTCKEGGCFKTGWYHVDQGTQVLRKEIICHQQNNESDCLKYGWTSYSRQGQEFSVQCYSGGCAEKGWLVQFFDGRMTHVNCKSGGCFFSGWREINNQ
ncbi:MAG: hypothetical protein AB7N80_02435 [Bdellovibrionales bacterium]